jgi:hypothetical protein
MTARSPALKAAQEKYLSGKSTPLTFRLDGAEREKLRSQRRDGESESQAAKRLLREWLDRINPEEKLSCKDHG